jgi:flavin reductase (DIM6/NTAB) family NADH-FMN oxidoreductase RutF
MDEEILHALRAVAMPVCIVGVGSGIERSCATGTLSYVSLRPPMISTSLSRSSMTYELAHKSGFFSISLLRDDQASVAASAGRRGATKDKFSELDLLAVMRSEVPALEDCNAVMWCSIEQECAAGDYVVCVGRIEKVTAGSKVGPPLLRYEGRYHAMGEQLETTEESTYPL